MMIKIIYNGLPNKIIDDKIEGLLSEYFKWVGQGYDFKSEIRDICYEIDERKFAPDIEAMR